MDAAKVRKAVTASPEVEPQKMGPVPVEREARKIVNVDLPESLWAELREVAFNERCSMRTAARAAIAQYVRARKP